MNKLKKIKIFVAFLKKYDIIYLGSVFFGITRISLREQANIKGEKNMFSYFKKKKTNYGKIVAITVAVVAAAGAIAFIIYKLIKKYTEDLVYDCDDLLDECDDCDLVIDDGEEAEEVEAVDEAAE